MKAFLDFVDYLTEVFRSGDALNEHLAALPAFVQEYSVGIGEWIVTLLGGG